MGQKLPWSSHERTDRPGGESVLPSAALNVQYEAEWSRTKRREQFAPSSLAKAPASVDLEAIAKVGEAPAREIPRRSPLS
jgi:hypothetical protein